MSNLISGKDALVALANGEEVEICCLGDDKWHNVKQWTVGEILRWSGCFRLKPRTITLNGIEVPTVRFVAHSGGTSVRIACYSIEDAKIINDALRSVFK